MQEQERIEGGRRERVPILCDDKCESVSMMLYV